MQGRKYFHSHPSAIATDSKRVACITRRYSTEQQARNSKMEANGRKANNKQEGKVIVWRKIRRYDGGE